MKRKIKATVFGLTACLALAFTAVFGCVQVSAAQDSPIFVKRCFRYIIIKEPENEGDVGEAALIDYTEPDNEDERILIVPNHVKYNEIRYKVTTIAPLAFCDAKYIRRVELPEFCERIDLLSFFNCEQLKYITIPEHVSKLSGAFIQGCPSIKEIYVEVQNPNYVYEDGYIFSADKKVLVSAVNPKGDVVIPDEVEEIGLLAFFKSEITSVKFNNSVKKVGDSAFCFCESLREADLGKVKTIVGNPFAYCPELTTLKLSGKNTKYVIKDDILYSASGKKLVCGTCAKGSINLPEEVTTINDSAFLGNENITQVIMPKKLKTIGDSAFCGCNNLKKVRFASLDVAAKEGATKMFADTYYSLTVELPYSEDTEKLEAVTEMIKSSSSDGTIIVTY